MNGGRTRSPGAAGSRGFARFVPPDMCNGMCPRAISPRFRVLPDHDVRSNAGKRVIGRLHQVLGRRGRVEIGNRPMGATRMPFERRSMYRAAAFAVGIAISGFPLISSTGAQAHTHHMGMRPATPAATVSAPKAAARTSVNQPRTSVALPKKARVAPARTANPVAPARTANPAAAPAAPSL